MAIRIIYHLLYLTGGTNSDYLDYADGNSLSNNDIAYVINSGIFYVYKLNATSGAAESSPWIISPDTNAGTKRWILISVMAGITPDLGSLIPSADLSFDLGSPSYRWANIYTGDLHLKNSVGDFTIIEGEDDLYLINNKTGKKSKIITELVKEE